MLLGGTRLRWRAGRRARPKNKLSQRWRARIAKADLYNHVCVVASLLTPYLFDLLEELDVADYYAGIREFFFSRFVDDEHAMELARDLGKLRANSGNLESPMGSSVGAHGGPVRDGAASA